MPKRNLFVLLMMIVTAVVAWMARDRAGHGRRFAEVLGAIDRAYLEPVDQQSLFDAAMEGVFSRLDEHSAFVAGDRRDELESLLDQEFGGIGVELTRAESHRGITVVSPVLGSPAWHAGIAAGDRILAIDGMSTLQMPLAEAFRRLRGKPGEPVLLSVASRSTASAEDEAVDGPARDIALVREVVKTESVLGDRRRQDGSWEWMIEGEPAAAIVRITSFGERTTEELNRAVEAITSRLADAKEQAEQQPDREQQGEVKQQGGAKQQGGTKQQASSGVLILDLRGNAGGLLSAAVDVCDVFLDDGVIVSTKGRAVGVRSVGDGGPSGDDAAALDVRRATRGAALGDIPMAVLVDGLTASAAEVVAACLQDHGRAIVVGNRSFGKGTVQSIMPLSDGSGLLKLTTSEYLRPSRLNIHRRSDDNESDKDWGVSPDRGCELTPTGRQIEALQAWRRMRDVVPPKGGMAAPTQPESQASQPRRVDPVLAKAVDAIRDLD
jgi:carboxyl-terminal processing protease